MPRRPTTSSSGKPSASLRAPLLSDGGPRGRGEDRIRSRPFSARPPLFEVRQSEPRSALSELMTASMIEDMVFESLEVLALRMCSGKL